MPEENKNFIGNKNIKASIYRAQATNSITCGYFCIGSIDSMFADKTCFLLMILTKSDSIIFSYFKDV